jgi:nicotinamidase-related amidase
MSGLWGSQTALDLYLQEQGISTLLFAGVNADQVRDAFLGEAHPLSDANSVHSSSAC